MSPLDALPDGYDNSQKGDWNFWPFKYIKPSWTAFGYRSKHWWSCWRKMPVTIFAAFGSGYSRWETSEGEFAIRSTNKTVWFYTPSMVYLSAIQYWCSWSIQIGWPFFFAIHCTLFNNRVWYFRIGARRNADGFFDFPSAHIGDFN